MSAVRATAESPPSVVLPFRALCKSLLRDLLSQRVIAAMGKLATSLFECHIHVRSGPLIQRCHVSVLQPLGIAESQISNPRRVEN